MNIYDVLDVKFLELLKIHIEHNKICEITSLMNTEKNV